MSRLLAIALFLAVPGLVLAQEPRDPEPKKEKKKEGARKPGPRGPEFPDIEKFLPADLPAEQRDKIRKQYREAKKQFEEMKKRMQNMPGFPPGSFPDMPGGFPGMPGMPAMPGMPGMPAMRGMGFMMMNPRLGVSIEPPSATLISQLDLPKKQGIVIRELLKDSAADKAGLKSHDILWELDGKPVPSKMESFMKMLQQIKPDQKVDAVVIRRSKKVTLKDLTIPEGRGFPNFVPGGFPPGGFSQPPALQPPPAKPAASPPADRRPE